MKQQMKQELDPMANARQTAEVELLESRLAEAHQEVINMDAGISLNEIIIASVHDAMAAKSAEITAEMVTVEPYIAAFLAQGGALIRRLKEQNNAIATERAALNLQLLTRTATAKEALELVLLTQRHFFLGESQT